MRRFVADLFNSGLSYVAAKVYISSVRSLHIVNCLPDPTECNQLLFMMLNGWKRNVVVCKRVREPIMMAEMRKLKLFLKLSRRSIHDKRMLWSACTMAFFGFLRVSEFTANFSGTKLCFLKNRDVQCDSGELRVCLRISKNSQFNPLTVVIPETNRSCCAVRAFFKYSVLHGERTDEPVFTFEDAKLLTRQRLSGFLQEALGTGFTTHSFRMGAATTASQCGVPIDQIRVLGRWRSDAYTAYVKTNVAQTRQWIQSMAG